MFSAAAALPLLSLLAQRTFAIDAITSYGSKFFDSDGAQFYLKGVAYQPSNDDPLANTAQCTLDASLMQTLGVNAIRVYHVDASEDHDGCMSAFADAGIYALIDMDTFDTYILPGDSPEWTTRQYDAFKKVMDAFQGYDNTLAFFVGNEMLTDAASTIAAPYLKAAAKDMKAYRDSKNYRAIPVGYSAADVAILRPNLQNYLACGDDAADALDFYALNAYQWCGDSSYDVSGYDILEQNATGYRVPIFFSEDGCNTVEPRTFTDQAAILGPDMDSTWSGAIIYEWVQATNDYGLIEYGAEVSASATASNVIDGWSISGTPTAIQPDFDNLSSQWATLTPSGTSSADYTPSSTSPTCPAYTADAWLVSGDVALPTLGEKATLPASSAAAASGSASSSSSKKSGKSGKTTASNSASGSASASAAASSSASKSKSAAPSLQASPVIGSGSIALWMGVVSVVFGLAVGL